MKPAVAAVIIVSVLVLTTVTSVLYIMLPQDESQFEAEPSGEYVEDLERLKAAHKVLLEVPFTPSLPERGYNNRSLHIDLSSRQVKENIYRAGWNVNIDYLPAFRLPPRE
jgi:hypothetical protein